MSKSTKRSGTGNYVVGIGASAGGLEAINELFDNMPANTGFSFVIVQHLSPDYKSLMADLLSKHTEMKVFEATEDMPVKPNCIYLIPARKTITLENGRLKLEEKVRDHQPNSAIDIFFESLAKDQSEMGIGIILSGTGTDGTRGIQAIKNSGGAVAVQDPVTAQFDGMPNSAIASGYVDMILSPDMMADELLEFVREAPLLRSFNELNNQEEEVLVDILALVQKTTGHDFSKYKRPTINRRMARRMAERNIRSVAAYYTYLQSNIEEVTDLCREFLLHVTRFFRDPEAYDLLKTVVIPEIDARKEPGAPIKVWVSACSTGEEAYSLAMLFEEYADNRPAHNHEVKIFASDISQDVIDIASRGFYSDDHVSSIPAGNLKRFFIKEPGGYRVVPAIRKMIVFARHDIAKDPPFSKIDLLTCRNMLIYMNPVLQKNILQKLHFAINDDGYLFLGPSENIGVLKDVMVEVDKKWKLFKCISKSKVAELESFSNPAESIGFAVPAGVAKAKNALNNIAEIFKDTLLEEYEYAGIFVDKNFDVKQAVGHFKKFLEFPDNNFNFNLLKLVPPDLSIALSTGIRKAMKDNERVVLRAVRFRSENVEKLVTVIIKPYLVQKAYLQPFVFVILKEEVIVARKASPPVFSGDHYTSERILELEQELVDTKENLHALLEEVESSNEQLQSSNEEIVSSNEELQSTNEELQSLNEELHTVNAEHQLKIRELIELNDDLNNYFRNSEIGQILIDRRLIIRKFTPAATKQVNLIKTDIGRSIVDISTKITGLDFVNDIKEVIQTGEMLEKEIRMDGGRIVLMRIAPYLRENDTRDGAVINFVDISEIKRLGSVMEASYAELQVTAKQLESTNYKLQQSNLDLVQFASVASHDLKEPLRKIQVFGNMLREKAKEKLDKAENGFLSKMVGASSRMETLIDNILILSRLSETDKPHAMVDLNEVVSQIINDLEISIQDKGVNLTVGKLPALNGIAGQMHQLFQNLISNSIKFNNGKPEINIWEEPLEDELAVEFNIRPGDYHAIHIRDNGIGFDGQRYGQKIFGLFQRLDPTNYKGTGIGLAIVKKIIDNHKGFIKAYSKPGESSLFVVILPR
jgi:two-component system, chemotaxis family, CheB/CheR fusion protein